MSWFKRWIIGLAVSYMEQPDVKDRVISLINAKVDVPRVEEPEERKLFDAVWDAILSVLRSL